MSALQLLAMLQVVGDSVEQSVGVVSGGSSLGWDQKLREIVGLAQGI